MDAGELAPGTFGDQYKTCKRVLSVFGGNRLADDLAADDFETLRAQIAKTYGKLSRKVEIKRVRSIFRYAYVDAIMGHSRDDMARVSPQSGGGFGTAVSGPCARR